MIRKIYYIEDDPNIARMLQVSLQKINKEFPLTVETFKQYELFKETLDNSPLPNLIMVDLMLPTKNGHEILIELKADPRYRSIPVVVVSARLAEYERYLSHEEGAAAYFTKPFFGLGELNSSLKYHMGIPKGDTIIMCSDISLDESTFICTKAGVTLDLTQKEFELMRYFAKNNNIAASKQDIYEEVWGPGYVKESRSLDMHVNLLRRKVFPDSPNTIKTITKFGYKLEYNPKS